MYLVLLRMLNWLATIFLPKQVYKWLYILAKTLPRDIKMLLIVLRVYKTIKEFQRDNWTISKMLAKRVKMNPNKVAFYFEDEAWTFEKVNKFSNQIANFFEKEGYKKGDTIALLLENCIAYPAIWIGLSKTGIVTALINTNLVKDSLMHSLNTANCKAVIFGTSHTEVVKDVLDKLQSRKLYQFRTNPNEEHEMSMGSVDLTQELSGTSDIIENPKSVSVNDRLLFIYTSGTTGLPKAALVTHIKYMSAVIHFGDAAELTENDVLYNPLPLYHGAGGAICAGQAICRGSTIALRKNFSASNYIKDCIKYKATVGQYVGELCRYILAVNQDSSEKYQIKTFIGNGLKPQIWERFVKRFNVKKVAELYGATEGNVFLTNTDGTIGAVGFVPRYLKWAIGITNIKCIQQTGEPIRNSQGFCTECDVNEPGILISKINQKNSLITYDGYTDKQASEKKILQNVFRKGDMYFNSGDILEYDQFGYFYFKDRTGDTFRWKGENVSTSEVEAIISNLVYLNDVAVYGVEVPHGDGKAGMAAIVDENENLNLDELANSFKKNLPKYAIPLFIRLMKKVPITGTFKLKKTELKEEGFDIAKVNDKIYLYQPKIGKYISLTKEIYEQIENGELAL